MTAPIGKAPSVHERTAVATNRDFRNDRFRAPLQQRVDRQRF